ncbi:MAG: hypothetical protein DDT29_01558 [Dehalococcoidia bacterium]|nr:hypothetical protein [Bacillota bacterium]
MLTVLEADGLEARERELKGRAAGFDTPLEVDEKICARFDILTSERPQESREEARCFL